MPALLNVADIHGRLLQCCLEVAQLHEQVVRAAPGLDEHQQKLQKASQAHQAGGHPHTLAGRQHSKP